jgi:hypothetical protein
MYLNYIDIRNNAMTDWSTQIIGIVASFITAFIVAASGFYIQWYTLNKRFPIDQTKSDNETKETNGTLSETYQRIASTQAKENISLAEEKKKYQDMCDSLTTQMNEMDEKYRREIDELKASFAAQMSAQQKVHSDEIAALKLEQIKVSEAQARELKLCNEKSDQYADWAKRLVYKIKSLDPDTEIPPFTIRKKGGATA